MCPPVTRSPRILVNIIQGPIDTPSRAWEEYTRRSVEAFAAPAAKEYARPRSSVSPRWTRGPFPFRAPALYSDFAPQILLASPTCLISCRRKECALEISTQVISDRPLGTAITWVLENPLNRIERVYNQYQPTAGERCGCIIY